MPQQQTIGHDSELSDRAHPVAIYEDDDGITYTVMTPDGTDKLKVRFLDNGFIRITLPEGPWVAGASYLDGKGNRACNIGFWPRPAELKGS